MKKCLKSYNKGISTSIIRPVWPLCKDKMTSPLPWFANIISAIPVFDGDPLQFSPFTRAFEQGVESKAGSADCLYYLEQFTRGQPQELMCSCQHIAPDHGYKVAKGLLQEHFGNPYKVTIAYMKKALARQAVKAEDLKALQDYSLFLCGCCNVMG